MYTELSCSSGPCVSLTALVWGYGAFVAPYSTGGWWGMGPNMVAGPECGAATALA